MEVDRTTGEGGEMRDEMGETTAGSELEERWSEVEGRGAESPE